MPQSNGVISSLFSNICCHENEILAHSDSYQAGVSDSGVITKIDNLVGEQARSLLSTELAQDLKSLTDALRQSETAQGSKADVTALANSIKERCSKTEGAIEG